MVRYKNISSNKVHYCITKKQTSKKRNYISYFAFVTFLSDDMLTILWIYLLNSLIVIPLFTGLDRQFHIPNDLATVKSCINERHSMILCIVLNYQQKSEFLDDVGVC